MAKRDSLFFWLFLALFCGAASRSVAQDNEVHIHVNVNLVQLNVAVTDKKGNYVTGLRPQDFVISEDRIPEKISTFGEGDQPARDLADAVLPDGKPLANGASDPSSRRTIELQRGRFERPNPHAGRDRDSHRAPAPLGSMVPDANVFILFDTSDYMYRGFVYAQDAITDFVRSLGAASKVAFYSYSRDLYRVAPLTTDRSQVLRGVRSTVAGDQAALYNCLLLTVKDAAKYTGRKIVVVFSNGPDNSSLVPPEDVAELAQSTGTVIYMISTRAGTTGAHLHRRLRAHEQGHRGQGLFCQDLARRIASLFVDPRRLGASLFDQLLSATESELWLAHDHGETGGQRSEEVPYPDA